MWSLTPGTHHRSALGGLMVLGPNARDPELVTGPTADIAPGLVAGLDVDDTASRLADRYGADLDTVRTDLAAFLDELARRGLAERTP